MSDQLNLFELSVLRATSKTGNTGYMYDYVQESLGVTDDVVNSLVDCGNGRSVSEWKRKMRWIQQDLKRKNYVERTKGGWKLTGKGKRCLTQRTHGMKVAFMTASGVALWGETSLSSGLFIGEVDLIVTSPEYPLTNQKEYADAKTEDEYIEGMVKLFESWIPMLTPTGSIVLNIGDTFKNSGREQSLYKERLLIELNQKLGLSLLQRFEWASPTKLPNPIESVCKRRTHCISTLESFYWLSPNPEKAKSDNRNVLLDYSESQKRAMASHKLNGGHRRLRPSGNTVNDNAMLKDNGGSISGNLIVASPEGANAEYLNYCRAHDLPIHPARFPNSVCEFFIRFLTDPGDFVFDPFLGSARTGRSAQTLGRYWAGADRMLEYLLGAAGRFDDAKVFV